MLGVVRRCCINIVNSLNVLHFQVCDEKRKLLNFLEFSGIMQQRPTTPLFFLFPVPEGVWIVCH